MADEENYDSADAGTSHTYPQQASALRKNGFAMIKAHPCKIVEMSTSKTGKHGHAKVHFVGIDILSGKKYEDICPSTHNMQVPHVKRTEMQVLGYSKSDKYFELMTENSEPKDDLKHTPQCDTEEKEIEDMLLDWEDSNQMVMATIVTVCGDEIVKKVEAKTDTTQKKY